MRKYFVYGLIIFIIIIGVFAYSKTHSQKEFSDINQTTTAYKYPFALIQYTDSGFKPQVIKLKVTNKARVVFTNISKTDVHIMPSTTQKNPSSELKLGTIPHGEKGYFKVVYLSPGEYEFVNTLNTFQKGLIIIEK